MSDFIVYENYNSTTIMIMRVSWPTSCMSMELLTDFQFELFLSVTLISVDPNLDDVMILNF